ncbi:hypothetical protein [Stenotrophomonas maltophilia]|uniref:hypothetical protein n=1 Tax=Stenotrophomonas maltophilia TaxID=40324 RepID=UPI0021C6CE20|nr:hypothetical protein [Stenotrophomonas maltophilia]MCU1136751.1 hypothetical protein [Stenotrophomonas maltophilia]
MPRAIRDLEPPFTHGRIQAAFSFQHGTTKFGPSLRLAVDEHHGLYLCRELSASADESNFTQHEDGRWRSLDAAVQWLASRYQDYVAAGWRLVFMFQTKAHGIDLLQGPWFNQPKPRGASIVPPGSGRAQEGLVRVFDDPLPGTIIVRTERSHGLDPDRRIETATFVADHQMADFLVGDICECWSDLVAKPMLEEPRVLAFARIPALQRFSSVADALCAQA